MNLAVIDPGVFVAGVFWRHEPHRCLKAWLRGMMTPVMTEDMLAEYEAGLEQVKQEQQFTTDTGLWVDALCASALWVEWEPIGKRMCHDFKDEKFIEAAVTAGCSRTKPRASSMSDRPASSATRMRASTASSFCRLPGLSMS